MEKKIAKTTKNPAVKENDSSLAILSASSETK